jgi:hypothetical protein
MNSVLRDARSETPKPIQGESAAMIRYFFASLAVALLAGCQTIGLQAPKSLSDHMPALTKEARAQSARDRIPSRVVAIWSDAVYTQAGHSPVRGFGGRIYFYNDRHDAVPVDGQLIVYGFDDSTPENPNKNPSRKFVFTDEQLASRHSVTELGDSYSIWLPWDEVTGFQTTISLLPVFVPNQGQTVVGPQTVNVLPGKTRPGDPSNRHGPRLAGNGAGSNPAIRQVTYESQFGPGGWQLASPTTDPQAPDAPRMKTTTISLPHPMTQRLIQEAEAQREIEATAPGGLTPLRTPAATGLQPMGELPATAEPLDRPAEQTSTRFVRPRSQAPKAASGQRGPGLAPSPPGLAAPQFGHPSR